MTKALGIMGGIAGGWILILGTLWVGRQMAPRPEAAAEVALTPQSKMLRNADGEWTISRDGKSLVVLASVTEQRVCLRWKDGGGQYCLDKPDSER